MAQDPLNVLWVEPTFPGRLGAVADWLVRRRGYRSWFYCHTVEPRESWPDSVGHGLDVQVFNIGGVARDQAVTWSRTLERSLCYAYGCWEVLEQKRPRPVDLVVGRSNGLGSSLFAPVYWPGAPVVSFLDYFYQSHRNDLADDASPETSPAYFHWRRSMAAIELLDLEQSTLGWTPTEWQQGLFPAEYRHAILVQHDGIDTRRFNSTGWHAAKAPRRVIAGRAIPDSTRVVSFVSRSLERVRGFDRFLAVADAVLRARADALVVIVGDSIVRRGLDVEFHNKDYAAHLLAERPPADRERLWFLGPVAPPTVAEILAGSDLHIALGRPYPIARSLLEAMAAGCVVLASDTEPHREVIAHERTGLLAGGRDDQELARLALAVLANPAAYQSLGTAAAELVHERYSREVCLPRLAERFAVLAGAAVASGE
jgi:glycosyltransferase involved in cell wall biosynthesis